MAQVSGKSFPIINYSYPEIPVLHTRKYLSSLKPTLLNISFIVIAEGDKVLPINKFERLLGGLFLR